MVITYRWCLPYWTGGHRGRVRSMRWVRVGNVCMYIHKHVHGEVRSSGGHVLFGGQQPSRPRECNDCYACESRCKCTYSAKTQKPNRSWGRSCVPRRPIIHTLRSRHRFRRPKRIFVIFFIFIISIWTGRTSESEKLRHLAANNETAWCDLIRSYSSRARDKNRFRFCASGTRGELRVGGITRVQNLEVSFADKSRYARAHGLQWKNKK